MILSAKTASFQLAIELEKKKKLKRFTNTVKKIRLVFPQRVSLGEWREEGERTVELGWWESEAGVGRIQMCKHLGAHGPDAEWKPRV